MGDGLCIARKEQATSGGDDADQTENEGFGRARRTGGK
jgi:hypothetical protein